MKTDLMTDIFQRCARRAVCWLMLGLCGTAVAACDPVVLTPAFSSPVTNSAPGTAFIGQVAFAPSNVVLSLSYGGSIIKSYTVVTNGTNAQITLVPKAKTSGSVSVRLTGTTACATNVVDFDVVFQRNPPTISVITNRFMQEDTQLSVPFTVDCDADTTPGSLLLVATSSNTNLIDTVAGGMVFGGSGTNRTLTLKPKADENGTSMITVRVSDDDDSVSKSFSLTVRAVDDPSKISATNSFSFGDNVGTTNVFSDVTIGDVDHNRPNPEMLQLTVKLGDGVSTIGDGVYATFSGGLTTFTITNTPSEVTSAIRSLGVQPLRYRGQPESINSVLAKIVVLGVADGLAVTNDVMLHIEVINTPPIFSVSLDPALIFEGQSLQPFNLDYISDLDIGDENFTMMVSLADPSQAQFGYLSSTNALVGNKTVLGSLIDNLVFYTYPGVLTTATVPVDFSFVLSDLYGGSAVVTQSITIVQVQTQPTISGIPVQTVDKFDASSAFAPIPTVFIVDPDMGGSQVVSATVSLSVSTLGTLSQIAFPPQTALQLTAALRAMTFTPTRGAIPVGTQATTLLTVVVTDSTDLSAQNNNLTIRISSVNNAPQILNIPNEQPLLIPPAAPLRPFAGLGLTNDDTNNILFTIILDDGNKGTLSNLGGFSVITEGYQMAGSVTSIVAALTNMTYTLNPDYLFSVDDPGGTTFTLSARDYVLLTSTRTLAIQVQLAPRNHLVVRTANDGLPGSFNYALAHAGNNDVITFALPVYPGMIRMPGITATTLNRNLTIKGPGANLLTISGDSNGDGLPDRQLFRIASRVTIEGVTLAHGKANHGGGVLVQEDGNLTLRYCAIVNCTADEYGGGIDVDGGVLTLESCFIADNRLSIENGFSGAGLSIFSDHDIRIVNTTFYQNRQANAAGAGGGALAMEKRTAGLPTRVHLSHCTFAGNRDASNRASAIFCNTAGAIVQPDNCIFTDVSGRNLNVHGGGSFESQGGNLCDDSTKVILTQGGGDVYLLDHLYDKAPVDPRLGVLVAGGDPTPYLSPLADSPAINYGFLSKPACDQRGVRRVGVADAGAIETGSFERLIINEIGVASASLGFIEFFARRDSTPVNLAGCSLYLDGVLIHDFDDSVIVGTNALCQAGAQASTRLDPGRGMVVAFTNMPFQMTSHNNPTPVIKPSITNAVRPWVRGSLTLVEDGKLDPFVRQSWLGSYNDPVSGTNELPLAGNSLSLIPEFHGFAFVPHHFIPPGTFSTSPGADAAGTPFGQDNAEPQARNDVFTVTEDSLAVLDVLANDHDSDGNDRLVIVDVSTISDAGVGDTAWTNSVNGALLRVLPDGLPLRGSSITYDPRFTSLLQQLPVGVELVDSFHYEIIDFGIGAIEGYSAAAAQTAVKTTNHRLATGSEITISGASTTNYNGTFVVTVVDADTVTIPVSFVDAPAVRGGWVTTLPRLPTSRSEALVTVRVMGENDAPVAMLDTITNVTEASTMRVMIRPERAGDSLLFPGDPSPAPEVSLQNLLENDDDIDADDTWSDLRVVGILGSVNPILDCSGAPGVAPVVVQTTAHGLATGDTVLIANYGGHASYNGYHVITVVNADAFTIPVYFSDNHAVKGVWAVLNDANRTAAITPVGVPVTLTLRADPQEDHLIYRAGQSAFLNGLAENERYVDRFWYAVADRHGAIGIGPVDFEVVGLNDVPVATPDPNSLDQIHPLITSSNTLEMVLASGLDLMYTLPPVSGVARRADLFVRDPSGTIPGTLSLRDFFTTDEETPLSIATGDLLFNDADIDRLDSLSVVAVNAQSREGATVSLTGGGLVYDPVSSANLQALARTEMRIDTFAITVSDNQTGGSVTSLVAVLVVGVNDRPVANPDTHITNEDECFVFDPRENDSDRDINGTVPDDRLRIIPVTELPNPGWAHVDLTPTNMVHDATVSDKLNQLAEWQIFTNAFDYTLTDNSFLMPVDDEFHVLAGALNGLLDVLANDRDFTDSEGALTIIDAGPTLYGGGVSIVSNGLFLVYTAPVDFIGDDTFRYTIRNVAGDVRSGRVMVRSVIPAQNGILHASDDNYIIAAGETIAMPVTANDGMLPEGASGLEITSLTDTSVIDELSFVGGTVFYTATNGLGTADFFIHSHCGGSSTARADVVAMIVTSRGTLGVRDDAFSVQPSSQGNVLDVLANDSLISESTAGLRIAAIAESASHGVLTINPSATALLYTPSVGFIGVERIRYVATDRIGGTGTAQVSISVGQVEAVGDFYKLEASTTNAVLLNVLANDRTLPAVPTSLRLISVSPSTETAIGTLSINGSESRLHFTANGTAGQTNFTYVVGDALSPARLATGVVSIVTVLPGTYANPDRYRVRSGGSGYVLDVLANDQSFPGLERFYSIISLGSGAGAPSAGGLVSIEANRLVYTPTAGFVGEERFTYSLSDAFSTDIAEVTVTVAPGNLCANDDDYTVFYEWDANANAPRAFELPVTLNDRLLPALDQVFEIVTLGVGVNAPNAGGSVSIASGGLTLTYRPGAAPTTEFTERFTYEIADSTGQRAAGQVQVRVRNRAQNLVALTRSDNFAVGRNSLNNLLPVLANDFVLPGSAAGWTITGVTGTQAGGSVSVNGAHVRYAPPHNFVGVDQFTYSVSDSLGGTGSGTVDVCVGDLPTLPSQFAAMAGSVSNRFDVLANDWLDVETIDEYILNQVFGTTASGMVARNDDNTVGYTPSPTYAGSYPYTEQFAYTVLDDSAIAVTGLASVVVHDPAQGRSTAQIKLVVEGRNDLPVILNTTTNAPITDKQSSVVFADVTLIEVDEQLMERLDVTVAIDDPAKGAFTNLQMFVDVGAGVYALSNVTAATATAIIRQLVYVPVENRITVPTSETASFSITVTDNRSPPVVDTQTSIDVTAVNDAPVILGTQADQFFYYKLAIQPFAGVRLFEVDDLTLQPLTVTVMMMEPAQGVLQNLGDFVAVSNGFYRATNLTCVAAIAQLRALEFSAAAANVPVGGAVKTHLQLALNDGFAPPVIDANTSVVAFNGYADTVRPVAESLQSAFGLCVDTIADYAVVGAPSAAANGANSGVAFVYQHVVNSTNDWIEWRQLLPPTVNADDRFGRSVSISDTWIAVGASGQDVGGVQSGSVYLFHRSEGGADNWGEWIRLAPTNVLGVSQFGLSVALSGDLLAVGAPDATLVGGASAAGAVFLFGRNQGGPNAWGELMRWSPADVGGVDADFGWSVALSGETLVVGAPKFNTAGSATIREGAVFHFERNQGGAENWGLVERIEAAETTLSSGFGWAVAVDGLRLAIGAPTMTAGSTTSAGRLYLYGRDDATHAFTYRQQLDRRSDTERKFGYSVAIDGDLLFVGAPETLPLPNLGAAYLYEDRTAAGGSWTLVEKFMRPAGSSANLYGRSLGMRQGTAIVGAPADASTNKGSAFLYRINYETIDDTLNLSVREAWDRDNFGDEVGNPYSLATRWGPQADPDADGAPNDVEYAFGGNPNQADGVGLLSIAADAGGNWVVAYVRRSNDPSIFFVLEGSTDLRTWFDLSPRIISESKAPLTMDTVFVDQTVFTSDAYPTLLFRVRALGW